MLKVSISMDDLDPNWDPDDDLVDLDPPPKGAPRRDRQRAVKIGKLDSLEKLHRAATDIFRRAARFHGDRIDAVNGKRLTDMLKDAGELLQASEMSRLEKLEAQMAMLLEGKK
jgi:hypothetical protein